jgi:hypothetical protein
MDDYRFTLITAYREDGEDADNDYDVLEDGVLVGRLTFSSGAPQGRRWMWASIHTARYAAPRMDTRRKANGTVLTPTGDEASLISQTRP